jgi:uracil phosphoribosyltransferase
MLATGGSAIHAVNVLKERGVPPRDIRFMVLVAAPEGVRAFAGAHPEVPVFTAALDARLDTDAYIVPGLGDAGDRIFGTH